MDDLLADLQNEDVVEPLAESQEEMTKDSALDLRPLLDRQKVKDLIEVSFC